MRDGWGDGRRRGPGWGGPPWARGGWDGRRSGPPWPLVGLLLLVLQLAGTTGAASSQGRSGSLDPIAYLLVVLGPLAWLVLPRRTIAVAAVSVGAAGTYLGLGYPTGPVVVSAALGLIVTVARGRRVAAWTIGLAGYGGMLAIGALSDHAPTLTRAVGYAAWLVVVLLVGEGPRYRAEQFAAARRARAAETEVAATTERLALARDLHDTIGHSLSMIAVQAGVALHLLDEHPEQARPALTAIRSASKEALEEVRSTLAILRQDDSAPPTRPGLVRVGELLEAARLGGLDVQARLDPLGDTASGLPPTVDAAAYRVVQEALTNVTRHADATRAWVTVRRSPDTLRVEVVDDGHGPGPGPAAEGSGLTGMRERAAALGGAVEAGAAPRGGFRVAVQFPLDNDRDLPRRTP
ncbi:MAG: sensor histidine kinase [Actinomycetales bacterium]